MDVKFNVNLSSPRVILTCLHRASGFATRKVQKISSNERYSFFLILRNMVRVEVHAVKQFLLVNRIMILLLQIWTPDSWYLSFLAIMGSLLYLSKQIDVALNLVINSSTQIISQHWSIELAFGHRHSAT